MVDDRLGRISRFDMSGRVIETAEIELRDLLAANTYRPGGPGMILSYANPPLSLASEEDITDELDVERVQVFGRSGG